MNFKDLVIFSAVLIFSVSGWAMPRRGPGLVPAGQSSVSFHYSNSTINQRFTSSGTNTQSLGGVFPHVISWENMGTATGNKDLGEAIRDSRKSLDRPMTAEAGRIDPKMDADVNQVVPTLVVGVNELWTMHATVPFSQMDYKVRSRFQPSADFKQTMTKAGLTPFEQTQIIQSLSAEIEGESANVGDAEVMNVVSLVSSFNFNLVGMGGVSIPTSRVAESDSSRSGNSGQGQLDFSLGFAMEFLHSAKLTSKLTVLQALESPNNVTITIVKDKSVEEEGARLDPGDVLNVNWDLGFKFSEEFSAGTFYNLKQKAKDKFSGRSESQKTYELLERDTETTEHLMGVSLTYTNNTPKRKKEDQAFSLSLTASRPFAGENIRQEEQVGLNLNFHL